MTYGEIWWVDFGVPFGSEPAFRRPALIVQCDELNRSGINTVVLVPLTSNLLLEGLPGNVYASRQDTGLSKDSIILIPQIRSVDKRRFIEKVGKLRAATKALVDDIILYVLNY